jgi:transcriptional regulator with XRE-family HTH domain
MELKDRIATIIKVNQLNASSFAEAIGVQRSSLSHILNGRNKPSLDFIEKVLHYFPRVDAQWLITGVQNEVKSETKISKAPSSKSANNAADKIGKDNNELRSSNKEIERVVIFYVDGTFEAYEHK